MQFEDDVASKHYRDIMSKSMGQTDGPPENNLPSAVTVAEDTEE